MDANWLQEPLEEETALEGLLNLARLKAKVRDTRPFSLENLLRDLLDQANPLLTDFDSNFGASDLAEWVIERELAHTVDLRRPFWDRGGAKIQVAKSVHAVAVPGLIYVTQPKRAQRPMLPSWLAAQFKAAGRRRRFRTEVVSPRKILGRLLSALDRKAREWSYLDSTDGAPPIPTDPNVAALIYAMKRAIAPPTKRIFYLLDAYRRDLLATTSSLALVAFSSREITPTQSVTPRSARPTTRNLCVIRRRPTIDRALRRARMSAAPLAAPALHSAARASETRTLTTLSRRSPRGRLLDRGGTRRTLAA